MFTLTKSGKGIVADFDEIKLGIATDGTVVMQLKWRGRDIYNLSIPPDNIPAVILQLEWCENAIKQAKLRKEGQRHESEVQ